MWRGVPSWSMSRAAADPRPVPRWWDILRRVWDKLTANHVSMLAAGVAFYAFLSLFPGLVAVVALYGLIADPIDVERHVASLRGVLPITAQDLVEDQLRSITAHSGASLSFTFVLSLGFSWWSGASAMKALMESLNIVYGEVERRSLFRFNLEALLFTLGGMIVAMHALVAVVAVPIVLQFLAELGLPPELGDLLSLARWPVLAAFVLFGLAVLYRFGPGRARPRWQWLSWGAIATTVLWLLGSALFSWYVSAFNTYNKTYGSLAAVVVLMLWLELSAYLVILGALLNAEIERGRVDQASG